MKIERIPGTSEMEVVLMLAFHIDNPCSIPEGNLRDFYLRCAEELIPTLENPYYIDYLKLKVAQYRTKELSQ